MKYIMVLFISLMLFCCQQGSREICFKEEMVKCDDEFVACILKDCEYMYTECVDRNKGGCVNDYSICKNWAQLECSSRY